MTHSIHTYPNTVNTGTVNTGIMNSTAIGTGTMNPITTTIGTGTVYTSPYSYLQGTSSSGIELNGKNADITINGRSLINVLDKIQQRLCILDEPDPAKLEKYQALKEAYEYYKLMEKLIGE